MAGAVPQNVIAELARAQVREVAPNELVLFPGISAAYFKDPKKVLAPRSGGDEVLGFGVGEAVVLMTPYIPKVTGAVTVFLVDKVLAAEVEPGSRDIGDLIKKLFKQFRAGGAQDKTAPPSLTGEQLREVRRVALEKLGSLGLPADRATLVADSIVGSLVVTES